MLFHPLCARNQNFPKCVCLKETIDCPNNNDRFFLFFRWRNWFMVTFLMSCVWISFFSYVMIWMITVAGECLGTVRVKLSCVTRGKAEIKIFPSLVALFSQGTTDPLTTVCCHLQTGNGRKTCPMRCGIFNQAGQPWFAQVTRKSSTDACFQLLRLFRPSAAINRDGLMESCTCRCHLGPDPPSGWNPPLGQAPIQAEPPLVGSPPPSSGPCTAFTLSQRALVFL